MQKIKKALILGSGGLKIGQAGEFDYSGSQAIKALKEEGIHTILVNPNIATVQTDANMADTLYLQPLNLETLSEIIEKEKPDAILLGFGGQTALNLGLELEQAGVLAKFNVEVMGTSIDSIRLTEDRELFRDLLISLDVKTPQSIAAITLEAALSAAAKIGYPVMMRSGFSLGGLGSGKINNEEELREAAREVLHVVPQILLEEYLFGWKEFEYEIVRDAADNVLTICNMENMDPMGVHTGESIVVAPAQTLSDREHQLLRDVAIRVARAVNIVGECNIQYAVSPANGDYRVIEMNARLSRSSALASKATGYPLAFVAAKLGLGYTLPEIKNSVTQKTCAFFEPALDYIVVKIPRWDTHKLKAASRRIGTEMKSVGEVMAIGRSFPEALQKAVRMLNIGQEGLSDYPSDFDIENEIEFATDRRLFALYAFFLKGGTVEKAHQLSRIEPWFLWQIWEIAEFERRSLSRFATAPLLRKIPQSLRDSSLIKGANLIAPFNKGGGSEASGGILGQAKRLGFSDITLAQWMHKTPAEVRSLRKSQGIVPIVKQIDTLAGEFEAETNYLYFTYHGDVHDILPSKQKPIIILGSGPYAIGSSVEFDWCAVNTARTMRGLGKTVVMVNYNPETVSTDYDESDRLYFEELTAERLADITEFENPEGLVISVGGQIANNLAMPLFNAGFPILGTPPIQIDCAENREKFSQLLNDLGVDQPQWATVGSLEDAKAFIQKVGYPVLLRPSYVLSGAAMNIVENEAHLLKYLSEVTRISKEHPVVVSQFIENAKELEMDAVAQNGEVVIEAIAEHIENAGVHSGDATIILPPEKLYLKTIRRAKQITRKLARALKIHGPFNIQFIAKENDLMVIECNVRASRSFPFVSKVTPYHFIEIAAQILLGQYKKRTYNTLELDYVAVKSPQFSYNRFKGADPVAHVEMASTGEVACIADDLLEAFYLSWQATGQSIKNKRVLISIADGYKNKFGKLLEELEAKGYDIFATEGTHDYLSKLGVGTRCVFKVREAIEPNIGTLIADNGVDLIINLPGSLPQGETESDGFQIRRMAIDHHIPLITNSKIAELMLRCLVELDGIKPVVKSWNAYLQGV